MTHAVIEVLRERLASEGRHIRTNVPGLQGAWVAWCDEENRWWGESFSEERIEILLQRRVKKELNIIKTEDLRKSPRAMENVSMDIVSGVMKEYSLAYQEAHAVVKRVLAKRAAVQIILEINPEIDGTERMLSELVYPWLRSGMRSVLDDENGLSNLRSDESVDIAPPDVRVVVDMLVPLLSSGLLSEDEMRRVRFNEHMHEAGGPFVYKSVVHQLLTRQTKNADGAFEHEIEVAIEKGRLLYEMAPALRGLPKASNSKPIGVL